MSKRSLTVSEVQKHLETSLQKAKLKNPRFTASALAKQLGMHETTMHKILRGERQLGFRLAKEVGAFFGFDVTRERRLRPTRRVVKELDSNSPLQTSWVHLAILELIKLRDFRPETSWVARRLGLDVITVSGILNEMEDGGLLRRDVDGWTDLFGDASAQAKGFLTSSRTRAMQKAMLEKSGLAIDEVDYEQRDHSITLVPIPVSMLPQIKSKIRKFRWDLCEMAQSSTAEKDDVYTLQIGFFPITQKLETETHS